MKIELHLNAVEPDFVAEEKGLNEEGRMVVEPGDELYIVRFDPVVLSKKDFESLLKRMKKHYLEVEL